MLARQYLVIFLYKLSGRIFGVGTSAAGAESAFKDLTYPVKAGKLPCYFTAIDTVYFGTLNESKYGPEATRLPASCDLSVQSG
jgi:hypothetical protein